MSGGGAILRFSLVVGLGGAAFGLAQTAWWLHTTLPETGPLMVAGQSASWAPELGGGADAEFVAKPLAEFTATLQRPLFEPERRPFVPKPPAPKKEVVAPQPEPTPPAPEKPRENLTIAGVKIFNGERQALIIVPSSKEARWVRTGDSIGGWRVDSITGAGAEVSAGETRRNILLYVDKR